MQELLEEALKLFDQGEYEQAVKVLIYIHKQYGKNEEIIHFIYDCFITPNEQEFKDNYTKNCKTGNAPAFEELPFDFIPVTEEMYYIYNKKTEDFNGNITSALLSAENYSEDGAVFMISDCGDIREIREILLRYPWKKCYLVLNDAKDVFYSFYKLAQNHLSVFSHFIVFDTIREAAEYFMKDDIAEMPEVFAGNHVEIDQKLAGLVLRKRKNDIEPQKEPENSAKIEFAPDFFHAEVRDGFEIPELMKRYWAAAIEMLKIVEELCEENHLTYFAFGGTLLGTIRHKGFIPWDDDIDLMMLRKDYDKLVQIISQQLDDKYQFASLTRAKNGMEYYELEHTCFRTIPKNWDYIEYMQRFHGLPFGVGIDIFVLDYVSNDGDFVSLQQTILRLIFSSIKNREQMIENGEYENALCQLEMLLKTTLPRDDSVNAILFDYFVQVLSMATEEESDHVASSLYFTLGIKNDLFKKEWVSSSIKVPFENTSISVPVNYHDVLVKEFHEHYMTPIHRKAGHEYPCYKDAKREMEEKFIRYGMDIDIEEFSRNYPKYIFDMAKEDILAQYDEGK